MTANLEGLAQPPEAAGTAYLWTQQGWQFSYLVCTNGAKGSDDESMTSEQLVQLRREEQRRAARLLGVKQVFFLDHVDGELTANRSFLGDVVRCIRQVRPHAVFTHDPEAIIIRDSFVNHADHRATGLTAIDAVYPAARDRLNFPEQVAAGLLPHKVREIYIWGSERTNFEVDISDAIETKAAALRLHESQFDAGFIEMILEHWKTPEGRYIEPFRRVALAF